MKYASINYNDTGNGPGVRASIFVTGCTLKCSGCFNEKIPDFTSGTPYTEHETNQIIQNSNKPWIKGLSLLGGEPTQNSKELIELCKQFRQAHPTKSIWCWSGYEWEHIQRIRSFAALAAQADVLVCGRFIETLKDPKLRWRGSSNQYYVDVQRSILEGRRVVLDEWSDEIERIGNEENPVIRDFQVTETKTKNFKQPELIGA